MTNTTIKPVYVYRQDFALELIKRGHEVYATMPNPCNNTLIMWAFVKTPSFEVDLAQLTGKEPRRD